MRSPSRLAETACFVRAIVLFVNRPIHARDNLTAVGKATSPCAYNRLHGSGGDRTIPGCHSWFDTVETG